MLSHFEGRKSLGNQMVETILHAGLKEIKKIYSLVAKSAKYSPIFAVQASFVLVLSLIYVLLVLCRIVLVSCRVVLVLPCVVLVLFCVVTRVVF